jgi:hypothetical protein
LVNKLKGNNMKKLFIYMFAFFLISPAIDIFAQNGTGKRAPSEQEIRERQEQQPYLQDDQDMEREMDEEEFEEGRKSAEENLNSRYPDAENVDWEFRHGEHVAIFTMNDQEYESHFSPDGTWQRTERALNENEVPENVRGSVEEFEKDAEITGYRSYETAEGTIYEVVTEHNDQHITHYYDEEGNVVQPPNYSNQNRDQEKNRRMNDPKNQ